MPTSKLGTPEAVVSLKILGSSLLMLGMLPSLRQHEFARLEMTHIVVSKLDRSWQTFASALIQGVSFNVREPHTLKFCIS